MGLVAVLSLALPAETYDNPVVDCGDPAVVTALGGGNPPPGREEDCRSDSRDQVVGALMFGVPAAVLLFWRRRRKYAPAPVAEPAAAAASVPAGRDSVRLRLARAPDAVRAIRQPRHSLDAVRLVFLAWALGLPLLGLVVTRAGLSPAGAPVSVTGVVPIVVATGLVALVATVATEPQLDCSDGMRLAQSWIARFMVRVGLASAPAVLGFALSFLAGSAVPYAVGFFAATALGKRANPWRENLARDQARLAKNGCGLSLTDALTRVG